jgi:hypothetical protein
MDGQATTGFAKTPKKTGRKPTGLPLFVPRILVEMPTVL